MSRSKRFTTKYLPLCIFLYNCIGRKLKLIRYLESQSNKAQTHDRNLKRIFWHWHWYDTSIRGWGIRQHWQKFDVSCVAWPQTIGSFIWVLDRRNAHRLIELTSNLGMHLIHVPILPPTYIICLWYRQPLYDKTVYAQFSARRLLPIYSEVNSYNRWQSI